MNDTSSVIREKRGQAFWITINRPDKRNALNAAVRRELLQALEDAVRDLGYERARLDTGPRQPHAEALYRSAGYEEIADYNGNPHASFFGEKRL